MVAVNTGVDSMDDIQGFRKDLKLESLTLLSSPSGADSIAKMYGVHGTPTTLILDADGKVTAQIIGGNAKAIGEALANLGFKD